MSERGGGKVDIVKIEVKKLPLIPNVCNQRLREVWKSNNTSVAFVETAPGKTSLFHRHRIIAEWYYILRGHGILTVGKCRLSVSKNTFIEIKPWVFHKMKNTGKSTLRYLVISTPKFDPNDVELWSEVRSKK